MGSMSVAMAASFSATSCATSGRAPHQRHDVLVRHPEHVVAVHPHERHARRQRRVRRPAAALQDSRDLDVRLLGLRVPGVREEDAERARLGDRDQPPAT